MTDMRLVIATVTIVIVVGASFMGWEALRWRRERDAQCAAALPLVKAGAGIDRIRQLRTRPPGEYTTADAALLADQFKSASDGKAESIQTNLRAGNRVAIFSESNSIMFVYFNEQGRAFAAECFLQ